jgi:hypothetical protein
VAKYKIAVIPHALYSPDLARCDFVLFSKMKLKLQGCQKIQAELQGVLDTVTEKDFQEALKKWRKHWDRCLHAGGNHVEGDGGR